MSNRYDGAIVLWLGFMSILVASEFGVIGGIIFLLLTIVIANKIWDKL